LANGNGGSGVAVHQHLLGRLLVTGVASLIRRALYEHGWVRVGAGLSKKRGFGRWFGTGAWAVRAGRIVDDMAAVSGWARLLISLTDSVIIGWGRRVFRSRVNR